MNKPTYKRIKKQSPWIRCNDKGVAGTTLKLNTSKLNRITSKLNRITIIQVIEYEA